MTSFQDAECFPVVVVKGFRGRVHPYQTAGFRKGVPSIGLLECAQKKNAGIGSTEGSRRAFVYVRKESLGGGNCGASPEEKGYRDHSPVFRDGKSRRRGRSDGLEWLTETVALSSGIDRREFKQSIEAGKNGSGPEGSYTPLPVIPR